MTEHDRFDAWLFHDTQIGEDRWSAMCGCGATFGYHKTVTEVLDAARPHFAASEPDPEPPAAERPAVVDLMAALEASLAAAKTHKVER